RDQRDAVSQRRCQGRSSGWRRNECCASPKIDRGTPWSIAKDISGAHPCSERVVVGNGGCRSERCSVDVSLPDDLRGSAGQIVNPEIEIISSSHCCPCESRGSRVTRTGGCRHSGCTGWWGDEGITSTEVLRAAPGSIAEDISASNPDAISAVIGDGSCR